MDPAMQEAVLIRQIQSFKTSFELREWLEKARAEKSADGLDQSAKNRINREYKAQLAALLQVELAGTP